MNSMNIPGRQIIQISTLTATNPLLPNTIIALCSDGTVWTKVQHTPFSNIMQQHNMQWEQVALPPQPIMMQPVMMPATTTQYQPQQFVPQLVPVQPQNQGQTQERGYQEYRAEHRSSNEPQHRRNEDRREYAQTGD